MLHLTDSSAHADFILSVQLQTLCILGQTTAESNCKPTSTANNSMANISRAIKTHI